MSPVEFDECYSCGKLFDEAEEEFIDIKVPKDKPEIIGDYMHFKGEDYYRLKDNGKGSCDNCNFSDFCCDIDHFAQSCDYYPWVNIKEIDITDDIAVLRPWVKCPELCTIFKLYAVIDNKFCIVAKNILDYYDVNDFQKGTLHQLNYIVSQFKIATISDLKKAGITE